MLKRIFPKQIDNAYRGHWLGIVFLVPIVLLRAVMGFNSIVFTHLVATGADGIKLDSFDPAGAQAVMGMFALLGIYLLLFALLGAVVLIRYRAMIPLYFLLLLLQQIIAKAVAFMHPVSGNGMPTAGIGSLIGLGLLAATILGFVFSLLNRSSDA